jgi:hypothetical protein
VRARTVGDAQPGKPLAIEARIGEDVGTPAHVIVRCRGGASGRFEEIPMSAAAGGYKAQLPSRCVREPAVQFFIEARDAKNRPLARRGTPERPLVVAVSDAPAAPPPRPVAAARATEPQAAMPAVVAPARSMPTARPVRAPTKKSNPGEDEENPFDGAHDPTRVVPVAPK